jgi:flagellar hook assembly protein FlgD
LRNREQRQAKNCFSLSHEVITPDGNGVADFTQIQMACEEPNLSANVLIFDMQGRKMRDLVNNRTISPAGYLTWDGIDNNGKRVPTGYYLIAVELFNAKNGHSDKVFLKVAVGE